MSDKTSKKLRTLICGDKMLVFNHKNNNNSGRANANNNNNKIVAVFHD